jgi:sodium transport system permease protein
MRGIWVVFTKELRETLRDRRTLVVIIVVPVVLYPALLIATEQLALLGANRLREEAAPVGFQGSPPPELVEFLKGMEDLEVRQVSAPEAAIRAELVQAVAVFEPPEEGEEATQDVRVLFNAADARSQRSRNRLVDALEEWSDTLLVRRLRARGLPGSFVRPLALADSSVARPDEIGGYALGRILPMLLIFITLLGAFYPAIDLAAGEKERGTLETLLTAPLPADQIVAGKFMTVAVVGVVAAGLNLASMLLTFQTGLFRFGGVVGAEFALPFRAVVLIFATLIPLAVLFGAAFLGVAVRARSFKEAQNALTPLYMLVLLPALLPLSPGIDFTPTLALVPVAGVSLFFRDLLSGGSQISLGALALLSTVVYALLALLFASRAFGSEEVLFGDGGEGERGEGRRGLLGLFRGLRSGARSLPDARQSLAFVLAAAILFFYFGRTMQVSFGEAGILLSEWLLLLGAALAFVLAGGFHVRRTFSLRTPRGRELLAALLIIGGGTPMAWFLAWLQSFVLPIPWEFLEEVAQLLVTDDPLRILWLLLVIAVTPAICEEAVFRGILLAGTRRRLSPLALILTNGVIFGAFHLSFETAFRFLPTAWLGILLAAVVWRTGSIWTGCLMHFVNNGAIVLIGTSTALQERLGGIDQNPPLYLLPVAVVLLAVGFRMLRTRPSNTGDDIP